MAAAQPKHSGRALGGVAVVTGASSGIGRAVSVALASCGMRLFLVGRSASRLAEVAEEVAPDGQGVGVALADLARPDSIAALASLLPENIDVLVHAAGVYAVGSDADDLAAMLAVNVQAPLALTNACLPALRRQRGQVVFMNSSQGAVTAGKDLGGYAASKHALRAVTDSLRQQVNADGVRVLSLFLGRTATPMQKAIFEAEQRDYDTTLLMQPEDVGAMVVSALSMPMTAEVTDIFMRPMRRV